MNCEPASIDAWLRDGGLVVTASERAARALLAAYHRARRAEGLTAWPTPNVRDWQNFVRSAWENRNPGGRLVLSAMQERSLWARIVAGREPGSSLLDGPRQRLGQLAAEAHQLLCAYAPQFLNAHMRGGWQQDAAEFSSWLAEFDGACSAQALIGAARLPLELIDMLKEEACEREPILLAGFDRILPIQRELFAAWSAGSEVRERSFAEPTTNLQFHKAADPANELAACATWCRRQLTANPQAQLLVIAQDVSARRGELERAFLRFTRTDGETAEGRELHEFSLGVPLGQIALARSAGLLLRWLTDRLEEHEVDWLFSVDYASANREESQTLIAFMRAIRRKGRQRTRWALTDFLHQTPGVELPAAWVARLTQAQRRLGDAARRTQAWLTWAELVPQLLETIGWPGARPLGSIEFQVYRSWQQTVDDCASLGFSGQAATWAEFAADLERAVGEAIFAPESEGAPILIAGPAESAGLMADAIWFLGASEDKWPANGATHPLLPLAVQRECGMPHASAQVDWGLAAAITRRLLASAPEVHFSYARQAEGVDMRPSRLIAQLAGRPQELPPELLAATHPEPAAERFADASAVPFPAGAASGGSGILTSQSQCAFRAFAIARLGAANWEAAEAGLTAPERGLLLHEVMHRIWAGPPAGIRSQVELMTKTGLEAFVASHVREVLREKTPLRARDNMPARYLELEGERLTALVTEWLRYEQTRVAFTVERTEAKASATIAGLGLQLRLDRVDRLCDDSLLVIDYKTGNVSAKSWELPRPDDVQLPLYAGFALDAQDGDVGGLVFAKLRAGECEFQGKVRAAKATLRSKMHGSSNLVKQPLEPEEMEAWRLAIVELAKDFLAGRADVNPREYPKTCEYCGLEAMCRVREMRGAAGNGDGAGGQEGGDE